MPALQLFGDFGFVGGENVTPDPLQNRQQCINFYPEVDQQNPKQTTALLGCPGLVQLVAAPGGGAPGFSSSMTAWPQPSAVTNLPVRGFWELPGDQTALVVIASTCYLMTASTATASSFPTLSLASVGTLQTSSGPVCIRDNNAGGYAVIVDGPYGYFYNISTQVFTQINDPAFLGADRVAFIDGWWIFNEPNSQTFYTNFPQYGTGFSGSYFALKDGAPDNLVTIIENKQQLWLIGDKTTEIWYDAGGQYFPFQRLVGTLLQSGCKAKHSISRFNSQGQDGLMWFGRSERGENVILRTRGFNTEAVSTPAFGDEVATYPVTSDAIGYTYQEDTHEFYVLTFPTQDVTSDSLTTPTPRRSIVTGRTPSSTSPACGSSATTRTAPSTN